MKTRKILSVVVGVGVLVSSLVLPRIGRVAAQSAEAAVSTISPVSYTTQKGGTGGESVSVLSVMDQSGTVDNPADYVLFTTPGSVYLGTQIFQMPAGISRASIASLKLTVNYKGLLPSKQKWTWSLYNYTRRRWIQVGSNQSVTSATNWVQLSFNVAKPANYVSPSGEMHVMLRSGNSSGDARIDYEAVSFTLSSPSPTATLTSLPPTATPSPTFTATLPPTYTPTPTSTPTTPPPSSGTAYYVSPQGNDNNPGTQALPWKTIQKAANTLTAGSTVIVQAGTYNERVSISKSGNSGAPIVFQAQGTVVMNGFTLVNANYVTINGFEITNKSLDSTLGWGIYVTGSNDVVMNNYIHDTTWGGILLYATATNPTQSSNDVVQGNRITHLGQLGIDVRGRNNIVQYNDISGTMQYPSWLTNPPSWVDADGIHFHGSGHLIRGNYIHDILYTQPENVDPHIDCFQTFVSSPYKEAASNVVFEQNRCENAQATGAQKHGSGFMINGASGITIRNNLIHAYVGVNGQNSSGLMIVNNTFTSDLTLSTAYNPAGITFTSVSSSTIENNILYNMPGQLIYLVSVSSLTAGRNLEYRSDGQSLWTTSSYSHANDLWGVNPLLVSPNDYHLQAGSPAIDAGYVVPVPNDYDGNLRPHGNGYDIGAYEK